jgi:hypothetical protein
VDFSKEKILWFGWAGQGSMAFDVKDDKGKVKVIFELKRPKDGEGDKVRRGALFAVPRDATFEFGKIGAKEEIPTKPCHPGCFPAGTLVETPTGLRPIETIRAGEVVLGVRPDGTTAPVKVQSIFTTPNRLVKVRTDGGIVFTTETQPLCLTDGRFRAAGELQKGDRIWRWQDGKRQVVTVLDVTQTERAEPVHNLVLGDSEIFIAGGFLARSKPPVDAVTSRSALPLGPARP